MSSLKKIMDLGYRPVDSQAWEGCGLGTEPGNPLDGPVSFVKIPGERDLTVREITEIRRKKGKSLKRLAKNYGVSEAQIKEILK